MKTFTLAIATIFTLTIVSCRQSDDVFSTEDMATIDIIETNRNAGKPGYNQNFKSDSINIDDKTGIGVDGEIAPPPRK